MIKKIDTEMTYKRLSLPDDIAKKKIILCKEEAMFLGCEGESILSGIPMMWCRTSTCNLRCSWFDKEGDIVVNCDRRPVEKAVTNDTASLLISSTGTAGSEYCLPPIK